MLLRETVLRELVCRMQSIKFRRGQSEGESKGLFFPKAQMPHKKRIRVIMPSWYVLQHLSMLTRKQLSSSSILLTKADSFILPHFSVWFCRRDQHQLQVQYQWYRKQALSLRHRKLKLVCEIKGLYPNILKID